MTTHEAEVLRAEADRIAALRTDVIQSDRVTTVTEDVAAHLETCASRADAIAYCWGWVVWSAERADWETVRLVIAAYKARWQSDGAA